MGMESHIKEYKGKLEKGMMEYMEMPASERSANAIKCMCECWDALTSMESGAEGKASSHEYEWNQEAAAMWNAHMMNTDGTTGGHWSIPQTNNLADQMGVAFEHISPWCWNVAVNMMYSDYEAVAAAYGVSTPNFYGEMAKAFLFDPDGPGPKEKISAYYNCIAHKDNW